MNKYAPTYNVDIHMAGDIALASNIIQSHVANHGLCVSISPQTYIYTGGREEGFRVGLINYPRFPASPESIVEHATTLADTLLKGLGQHSYSIVTPEATIWYSRREEASK